MHVFTGISRFGCPIAVAVAMTLFLTACSSDGSPATDSGSAPADSVQDPGSSDGPMPTDPCDATTNPLPVRNESLAAIYQVFSSVDGRALKVTNAGMVTLLIRPLAGSTLRDTDEGSDPAMILARKVVASPQVTALDPNLPTSGDFYLSPSESVCATSFASAAEVTVQTDLAASSAYYFAHSILTRLVSLGKSKAQGALEAVVGCAQSGVTLARNRSGDGFLVLSQILSVGTSCYSALQAVAPDDGPALTAGARAAARSLGEFSLDLVRSLERFHLRFRIP